MTDSDSDGLNIPMTLPYFIQPEGHQLQFTRIERKIKRNEQKILAGIARENHIRFVQQSKWILIWGPSMTLGISKKDLIDFVNQDFNVNIVEEARIYIDKIFAFVKIKPVPNGHGDGHCDNDGVFDPVQKSSGKVYLPHGDKQLYLFFIEGEPPEEDVSFIEPFYSEKPKGIKLYENVLTVDEEEEILSKFIFDKTEKALKNRAVQHFGYEFKYGSNDVDFNAPLQSPIPTVLNGIIERFIDKKWFPKYPDQLTVNRYSPRNGIPPHVDTHSIFLEPIASLSLGSGIVMDFKSGSKSFSLFLPPRSLLLLYEDSRFDWTHGIKGKTYDVLEDKDFGGLTIEKRGTRHSFTFRFLNKSRVCNCRFPLLCDSTLLLKKSQE